MGSDIILGCPGITRAKDLAGMRVDFESGALGAYLLTRALHMDHLKLSDVDVIHQTANEHVYTFSNNISDTAEGCEPERSILLKKGATIIFDSGHILGEIIGFIAIRKDFQ